MLWTRSMLLLVDMYMPADSNAFLAVGHELGNTDSTLYRKAGLQ